MKDQWRLVIDVESNTVCRVVVYDEVSRVYVITPVEACGGRWNDMLYDGVKPDAIRELTTQEVSERYLRILKDTTNPL
ncbi:MAG: hypothetical protein [Myoviridae sp. ctThM1]|nr:MAG: hypothetical protein [Myoviridae sp. ctThM1]